MLSTRPALLNVYEIEIKASQDFLRATVALTEEEVDRWKVKHGGALPLPGIEVKRSRSTRLQKANTLGVMYRCYSLKVLAQPASRLPKLTIILHHICAPMRAYARSRGVSLSKMVAAYLRAVTAAEAPILRSLRGVLKDADVNGYRSYLAAKYH